MGFRYTHQAITTEQQINILKEKKGGLIDDAEQAIEVLDTISYFRFAGYWRHFETDRFTHQVKEDSRFTDVIDFYFLINNSEPYCLLPSKRFCTHKNNQALCLDFGAFGFMDENYATNKDHFVANLAVIHKEVSRSHNDFIFVNIVSPISPLYGRNWRLFQWVYFQNSILIFRMLQLSTQ